MKELYFAIIDGKPGWYYNDILGNPRKFNPAFVSPKERKDP